MNPDKDSMFRDRLRFGPDFPVNFIRAHFIDSEAMVALRSGDLETFIERRSILMQAWDLSEWESVRGSITNE